MEGMIYMFHLPVAAAVSNFQKNIGGIIKLLYYNKIAKSKNLNNEQIYVEYKRKL